MQRPPVELLRRAASGTDLEIAWRARRILEHLETRKDPRRSVFRVIELKRLRIDPALLLKAIERCEQVDLVHSAHDALAATVKASDLPLVERALKNETPRVRAAAVRALGAIAKDEAAAAKRLRALLLDKSQVVRLAAARALIGRGDAVDLDKLSKLLDIESLVVVLRAEEQRMRKAYRDRRTDRDAMLRYQALLRRYADVLARSKGVSRKFNDHEHEVITTKLVAKHRVVEDLK